MSLFVAFIGFKEAFDFPPMKLVYCLSEAPLPSQGIEK